MGFQLPARCHHACEWIPSHELRPAALELRRGKGQLRIVVIRRRETPRLCGLVWHVLVREARDRSDYPPGRIFYATPAAHGPNRSWLATKAVQCGLQESGVRPGRGVAA